MLILFDVDGTLLASNGAGRASLVQAGRRLHGPDFGADGVAFAGRIDPQIVADLLAGNGVADDEAARAALRAEYAHCLEERLAAEGGIEPLPGVPALLDALGADPRATLGILSGNFAETGEMKLRAAGLDPERFAVRAWGSDAARRPDLVPLAIERHAALTGGRLGPERGGVVGDTEHDVACGQEHGCRVLAVATGFTDLHDLLPLWPDLVLEDLSATRDVLAWLFDES